MDDCTDPKEFARLTAIYYEALGMLNSFEDDVAHLLPACPVFAKFFKKRKGAQISGIGGGLKAALVLRRVSNSVTTSQQSIELSRC